MDLDPADLSARDLYAWMTRLITPRPIAWVSTVSREGVANLAPFSFFSGVGANPPTVVFCPANRRDGRHKDSLANLLQTNQFVVNVVTEPFLAAMNLTAAEFDPDVDEFQAAEVQTVPSQQVIAPRVAEAAAAMECELVSHLPIGTGPAGANVVVGRIVWMHVSEQLFDQDQKFDAGRLQTIGRMGDLSYVRTSDRFDLPRPPRPPLTS